MKRKDGRELVTEHPVTGIDMIDYIPRDELKIPDDAIRCRVADIREGSWGDEDPSSEDFNDWGA